MRANIPDPYDPPLSDQWLAGYAKRRRIAKKVVNTPGAYTAVSALANLFLQIGRLGTKVRMVARDAGQEQSIREMNTNADVNPVDYGSGFGFDEEPDDYDYQQYILKDLKAGRRSKHLPTLQRGFDETSRLIQKLSIKRVVNFGVALAWMDDKLAANYPNVEFIGIDRAPSVKRFNEEHYNRPNLMFVAADINEWIDQQDSLEGDLFVNMRTMLNFPESFVRDYYKKVYNGGAAGIYCLEDYGIPRETDAIYRLDYDYRPSVHYRNRVIMHNYPEMLDSAGFSVIFADVFENWWQDEDQRAIELSAKR